MFNTLNLLQRVISAKGKVIEDKLHTSAESFRSVSLYS